VDDPEDRPDVLAEAAVLRVERAVAGRQEVMVLVFAHHHPVRLASDNLGDDGGLVALDGPDLLPSIVFLSPPDHIGGEFFSEIFQIHYRSLLERFPANPLPGSG